MTESKILKAYEMAKEQYGAIGVDTDAVIDSFLKKRISLHCWQGDDVAGFEGKDVATQNVVTGNHPGKARNAEELRADIGFALSLAPTKHKVNLHSIYAEPKTKKGRDELTIDDFSSWISWAKEKNVGLDYNGSFFAHELMDNGLSLSSPKKEVRDFWVRHLKGSRKIACEMGKALNDVCVNNIWVPDGMKDNPASRLSYRERLMSSLDEGLKEKLDSKHLVDVVEGKLFGIGTECFVVGSYDFYLAYAMKNNIGICLDSGHFHPTENIADKFSALKNFVSDILLHISRGVRWDSDHVVTADEGLSSIMFEANRADMLDKMHIGLDYFDASINRVFAMAVGLRSAERVMLSAMLEPLKQIVKAEQDGDFTARLALMEEAKAMPINAVFDMACLKSNVPVTHEWIEKASAYAVKTEKQRI